jgi:hypothetical protein
MVITDVNRIGDEMVSMLAWSAVECGFSSDLVNPKTIKLVFVASLLSAQL